MMLSSRNHEFSCTKLAKKGPFFSASNSCGRKAMEKGPFFSSSDSRSCNISNKSDAVKKRKMEPSLPIACNDNSVNDDCNKWQKLGSSVDSVSDDCNDLILQQVASTSSSLTACDDEYLAKALRAAELMCLFSDLIAKRSGDKNYPKKAQAERERLLKIKSEKDALKETERREEIQRKRKLARFALEELERAYARENDVGVVKEMEKLERCYSCYTRNGNGYVTFLVDFKSGMIVSGAIPSIAGFEFLDVEPLPWDHFGETLGQSWSCQSSEVWDESWSCESNDQLMSSNMFHSRKGSNVVDNSDVEEGEIVD
ncbi:OLC1v1008176C1 [Oldenlandia corymbosa var. corymbosa]|uniref:OLC1v1008176C1 n=1 Tax=Oldenlandia corymbosa var. corymbosa TaxID=529605 RepID=A0AAV1DLB7_OLDCO|nr:OLC1v1008176C1 [Oldenlandia corymbosa var. corymbosa]